MRKFGGDGPSDVVFKRDTIGGVVARLHPEGGDRFDTIRIDAVFEPLLAPWVAVPLVTTDAAEVDRVDYAASGAALWHEDGAPVYWDGAARQPLPLDRADLLGPDGAVYGVRGGDVVRWTDGAVSELGAGTGVRGVTTDGRVYFDDRVWADGTAAPSDLPPGDIVTADGRVLAADEDRCRIFEAGEWLEFETEECAAVAGAAGGWAVFRRGLGAVLKTPDGWIVGNTIRAPAGVDSTGLVVAPIGIWIPNEPGEEQSQMSWNTLREPDRWSLAGGAGVRAMSMNDRGEVLTVAEDRETGAKALIILRPRD